MKYAAAMFATGALILGVSVYGSSRDTHPQPCGPLCWNAISRALWAAWNTFDCDSGYDQMDLSCNDDMQNVNTAAMILDVRPAETPGALVVRLAVRENNDSAPSAAVVDRFVFVVHSNGVVVRDDGDAG